MPPQDLPPVTSEIIPEAGVCGEGLTRPENELRVKLLNSGRLGLKSNRPSPGASRTLMRMTCGIIVAVLKEQHLDHLLLTDSTRVSLPEGLIVERLGPGTRITILYRREDPAEMVVVQSVTRSATPHLSTSRQE